MCKLGKSPINIYTTYQIHYLYKDRVTSNELLYRGYK